MNILYIYWASIILAVAAIVFCGVMALRCCLIFRARARAVDMVSEVGRQRIKANAITVSGIDDLWRVLESYPSWGEMEYDFRKWTFDQFYPGLTERLA